jgi:hypothetical protein
VNSASSPRRSIVDPVAVLLADQTLPSRAMSTGALPAAGSAISVTVWPAATTMIESGQDPGFDAQAGEDRPQASERTGSLIGVVLRFESGSECRPGEDDSEGQARSFSALGLTASPAVWPGSAASAATATAPMGPPRPRRQPRRRQPPAVPPVPTG